MWNITQSPQSLVGKMCEIYWSPQESIETLSMSTQGQGQQNQQRKNSGDSSRENTSREELKSRQTSNWDTSSLSSLTKTTVTTCSSTSSSSSSDAPPSPTVTDDDDGDFSNSDENDNDENGYDADWYDAHVKSYSPESSLYDVVFVGEEKVYRMPLSEKVVRPLNDNDNENEKGNDYGDGGGESESESDAMNTNGSAHPAQHEEINEEWNKYVVGKDWEVYWSTSSSSPSRSARDDNMPLPLPLPLAIPMTPVDDFDADWYDARIQSYSRNTNMFQVSFVGEDQVYDMTLCSSVLRPSARAWVRRTRALLDLRAQQVVDEKGCPLSCIAVRRALPQSTERWGEGMRLGCSGCSGCSGGAIDRVKDTQKTYLSACPLDQKFDIKIFRILLEEQVSLRSHLRFLPPENQDTKTSTNTNTNPSLFEYSEQHVDYLVQCLEHFIEACKWFISNKWSSFSLEMLGNGIDDAPMSKIKIEDIYVRLVDGVLTFVRALLVDTSKLSMQRRPSRSPLSITSINEVPNSHRRKRRRLTQSRHTQTQSKENEFVGKMGRDDELGVLTESIAFEYTTNIESIQGAFKAVMYHLRIESKSETDGGLSVEAIGMLIQKCLHKGNCSRYFVSFISDSLLDTVGHVWECIVSWIDGARKVLEPSRNLVEVQSIENLLTSGTIAIESNQIISDALGETQESIKLRVVQDLASHFNQAHTDKILCRFELKGYQREIEQWVRDVHHFQQSAWEIIARGLMAPIDLPTGSCSYNSTDLYEGDSIILKLKQLVKNPLCLDASESTHIVSPSNAITRQNIDIFIKIRTWMVHCHWILTHKERVAEIETVLRQKPDKIAMPSQYFMIEGKLVSEQIDCLKEKLAVTWMTFQELNKPQSQHPREVIIQDIKSENSCRQLLASWSSRKVLIDNEERIALLADIFAWNSEARSILSIESGHKKDFDSIRSHFKTFQNLKKGISTTRSALISGLLGNLKLDQKMATFSKRMISMHCNDVPCALSIVYNTGMEWERRAKLVLKALVYFGNESVACSHATSTYNMKVNNLIDLKVIDDLVKEYAGSSWKIPELYNNLCAARKDAHKWSKYLLSSLHGRHSALHGTTFTSPMHLDGVLQMQCRHRPKGILMFPSRQLTGEWAALLSWYNNCSETFDILVDHHASKSSPTGELSDEVVVKIVEKNREIESLFVTGRELFYAIAENDSACHFDVRITPEEQDGISNTFKCNSPTITLAKIASCEYSQKILESIIGYDLQRKEKGIMFLMKLYLWRYLAMQTLNKLGIQSSKGSKAKNQTKPTLQSTKLLLERVESLPTTLEIISKSNPLVASIYSTKYLTLYQLVAEAEMIELETKNALERVSQYDGSVSEAFVLGSLEELRSIRGKIKSVSDCGLGIAYSLANEVEKRIRDLNWMNSGIYHLKDETCSSFGQSYHNDRISLMTLLQMSDKAPSKSRSGKGGNALDIAMVDLYNRIKELKDNCAAWQTEVYEYIPRSARVSKRREIQSRYVAEDEELAIITASEIKKLLETPVTLDISMPEEDILCDAYFHANILEKSMEDLFSKDDYRVDRKGLPSFESLIGESGEFLLLRTIESNEFEIMKQKMTAMKPTLNNLSVRTPEKLLHKWLFAVLNWVDRFGDALLEPFQPDATMLNKIHLSMEDAKLIIDEGHELFSNISDVSRKHLLKLRVSVFVRNGTGRISIKKCKGGLNHSVGGTVLWWLAFCYNSLRNDMATTLHWSKRAKSLLAKSASISNLLALTGLHKEAEEFLMVAPDEGDIMTKIVETLNENSMPVDEKLLVKGGEAENKPVFIHNLFQKRA